MARDDDYLVRSGGDGLNQCSVRAAAERERQCNQRKQSFPNKNGEFAEDYEVDIDALVKMAAPCLVHSSSLLFMACDVASRFERRSMFCGDTRLLYGVEKSIYILGEAMDCAS